MLFKNKAFTFLELVIVVLIVGILLGVAIPSLKKTYDNYQIQDFSKNLQNFLNYIHERAVIEDKVILFFVDDASNRYYAKYQNMTVVEGGKIPTGLKVDLETEDDEFIFYPDGEISGVDINIADKNDNAVKLSTKGVFGFVKKYK